MSLIILSEVRELLYIPPYIEEKGASPFYVTIKSEFLSSPYELKHEDWVAGMIMSVRPSLYQEAAKEYSALEGKEISFLVGKMLGEDWLHIMKDNWINYFREYGLVTPGYALELELKKAIKCGGEEISLYTKRDEDICSSFDAAEALHANFYHGWMDEERFEGDTKKAVKLLTELDGMLDLRIESLKEEY